ncbi:hypothetical protein Tco_0150226 [Tanacetum coccineum]
MFLNVNQLQKQLEKDEFSKDRSMAAFGYSTISSSNSSIRSVPWIMTDKNFVKYTGIEMQTQEMQEESSMLGNDTDVDDANIRPIYDEEPMAKVQLTAECNIFAIGQQHTEQPEIINEVRVDQYAEQCQVKSPMLDTSLDNKTTEFSIQSLESKNICFKKTVAQFQKDFLRMDAHCEIDAYEAINIELKHIVAKLLAENKHLHKENDHLKQTYKDLYDSIKKTWVQTQDHNDSLIVQLNNKSTENDDLKAQIQEKVFAIASLKNKLRKLKGNSVDTKFAKTSVLGKPILQPLRNQSVVRQPTAFKSERPKISKPLFASQVDVKNNLSKPVTPHYFPKGIEYAFEKPHQMIASSESRNRSKNMSRFSSNDMFKPRTTMSTEVPTADMIVMTSIIELESLFGHLFDEYFNGENQVVSKSSAVTTADASDKRQQ